MSKKRLPDAELDVLAAVSRLGQATVAEVRTEIDAFRPMAHGSVVTLLGRLEAKGLVAKRKGDAGKAFVYHATRSGEGSVRPILRGLVTRLFAGNRTDFVATLFDGPPPSAEEVKALEELVGDLRKRKK